MQWPLFLSAFATVFLAELGDKTQLAAMGLAAGGGSRWSVFAGSASALVLSSFLAVLLGSWISRVVPPEWIRRGAGALFIVMGVLYLRPLSEGDRATPPPAESEEPS